jgi:hypothetical protein
MARTAVYAALLVGIGVVMGAAVRSQKPVRPTETSLATRAGPGVAAGRDELPHARDRDLAALQRRLDALASKLGVEATERQRLEQRLERLAGDLTALRGGAEQAAPPPVAPEPATAPLSVAGAGSGAALEPERTEPALTAMERALVAAGVDLTVAAEIKRHQDETDLAEIYLHDLAEREAWLDTQRFAEEMGEIQRRRTSVRDQIGDDAYDRYLAALNQPNRVAVHDVLLESPAAMAGLQPGDVVLRYGEARIFSPSELVAATRSGVAGEAVSVEIIRDGRRFEIEVPRGPLGVRIAASRGSPTEG